MRGKAGTVSRHGDKAREVLLDAAEELFASHGIDAVSNRKITEYAGTANHSAIKYHFGSREDLLQAMLQRALGDMRSCRNRLPSLAGGPEASLREVVTVRTLPWIYSFDALPRPSWRAQFLYQARLHPGLPAIVGDSLRDEVLSVAGPGRARKEFEGIPEVVVRSRALILGPMFLGLCAQYERTVNEGKQQGNWESLGYFLVDSMVGMLAAPSTAAADFMGFGED